MHLLDTRAAGGPQSRMQFMMGDFLLLHDIGEELAIMDQDLWTTLDKLLQGFAFVRNPADDAVSDDQSACGEDSSGDGVISSIHGVLHRVTQHEQQNEIEGRQLADLAFAGEAQNNHDKNVNDQAAHNEFPPGESWVPHGPEWYAECGDLS